MLPKRNAPPLKKSPEYPLKQKHEATQYDFKFGGKCIKYDCINYFDQSFTRIDFVDKDNNVFASYISNNISKPEIIPSREMTAKSLSEENLIDYINYANDICEYESEEAIDIYYQHMPKESLVNDLRNASKKANNVLKNAA